jgi:hypothetical protein
MATVMATAIVAVTDAALERTGLTLTVAPTLARTANHLPESRCSTIRSDRFLTIYFAVACRAPRRMCNAPVRGRIATDLSKATGSGLTQTNGGL